MLFAIRGRRHAGKFLKCAIEGGCVIETGIERNAQNCKMPVTLILKALFHLFHAVIIQKVKKILIQLFINDLR